MVEVLTDSALRSIATSIDFNAAVRKAFVLATDLAEAPPVLRVAGAFPGQGLNIKFCATRTYVGGKVGSYWSGNAAKGVANHEATTVVLDPETGYLSAIVAARYLNRVRTAVADAIAVDILSSESARTLAVIGTGVQAEFEAIEIAKVRSLKTIIIAGRSPDKASALADRLRGIAADVIVSDIEDACRSADIISTVTAAREPLVRSEWIRAGTHISAMGSDAIGKQELCPSLVAKSKVFADLRSQSVVVGECQHAVNESLISTKYVIELGDVIARRVQGRSSPTDITVFDSSGLAIQDLCVAEEALDVAREAGVITEIEL